MAFRTNVSKHSADQSTAEGAIDVATVLIAEQSDVVAKLLQMRLDKLGTVKVVGRAARSRDIVAQAVALKPRIVIMSHEFPRDDLVKVTRTIKKRVPGLRVIALVDRDAELDVMRTSEAGVNGYCLRDPANKMLETAVSAVLTGETWFDPALSAVRLDCSPALERKPVAVQAPADVAGSPAEDSAALAARHRQFIREHRRFPVRQAARITLGAILAAAVLIPLFMLLYTFGTSSPAGEPQASPVTMPSGGRMYRMVEMR